MSRRSNGGRHQVRKVPLSPREREALNLLVLGLGNDAIGRSMSIGTKSVENILRGIYAEFELTNETYYDKRVALVLSQIKPIQRIAELFTSSRCAGLSWDSGEFRYVSDDASDSLSLAS